MNEREKGFLLLSSRLGDPERKPLTAFQLRELARFVRAWNRSETDRELSPEDLVGAGLNRVFSERIVSLLSDELQMDAYLSRGMQWDCCPMTRVSPDYPLLLRKRMGLDSPGCLWIKGNESLLSAPAVSLVGSRDLLPKNRVFAETVGMQAARQGYVLVSGNARGADQAAQNACLRAGGSVISVIADCLAEKRFHPSVLYLSDEGFDEPFSAQRALHRNHIIHSLGRIVFVAQCTYGKGGTWDGTVQNLRHGRSKVFCFRDGSPAVRELEQMGAIPITLEQLSDFPSLMAMNTNLFGI